MKKSSLLLLALCAHITYVSHAGDDQSLNLQPQEEQNLISSVEQVDSQPNEGSVQPPVQEQHLDLPEPRQEKQELVELQDQSVAQNQASTPAFDPVTPSADKRDAGSATDNATVILQQDIPASQEESASMLSSCVTTIASYSKLQLTALTAGGALMGYGCYKVYAAVFDRYYPQGQKEQPMTLSAKDRDLLLSFAEAMAQDVRQARTAGKRKASLVQKFDISGLSMPLLIECNYIQSDFVKLYHQCDDEGNGIEVLNLFYEMCEFNHALKELIDQAQIV